MAPGTEVSLKELPHLTPPRNNVDNECIVSAKNEDLTEKASKAGRFVDSFLRRIGYDNSNRANASTQTDYDPAVIEARTIFLDFYHFVKVDEDLESWSPVSSASRTLWRLASKMLEKHLVVYDAIVSKLELSVRTDYEAFRVMCDEIFGDGQVTWGRVVVLYALFIQIARFCHRKHLPNAALDVADFVGLYVGEKVSAWITQEGSWDAINETFPPENAMEQKVWKGLLVTGIGLGMLATAIKAIR